MALSLLAVAAVLTVGCLGTLTSSAGAQSIALAPRDRLTLPIRENRPHWLLRSMSGWEGAHKVRFGGDQSDPNVIVVRVAVFQDEPSAEAALTRLTPALLYTFWRVQMAAEPEPFDYPIPLRGDEVRVFLYPLSSPSEAGDAVHGQFILLRRGRTVLVVQSIGVPAAELVPVLDTLHQSIVTTTGP
jgi:hypothetical protein